MTRAEETRAAAARSADRAARACPGEQSGPNRAFPRRPRPIRPSSVSSDGAARHDGRPSPLPPLGAHARAARARGGLLAEPPPRGRCRAYRHPHRLSTGRAVPAPRRRQGRRGLLSRRRSPRDPHPRSLRPREPRPRAAALRGRSSMGGARERHPGCHPLPAEPRHHLQYCLLGAVRLAGGLVPGSVGGGPGPRPARVGVGLVRPGGPHQAARLSARSPPSGRDRQDLRLGAACALRGRRCRLRPRPPASLRPEWPPSATPPIPVRAARRHALRQRQCPQPVVAGGAGRSVARRAEEYPWSGDL